eukprot:2986386-Karenia_brevis.AAC.1
MCAQPNLGCDSSAMVYAPGTWEVDTMKGEAMLTHYDIAIAQATSACKKWEYIEHHNLQTNSRPGEGQRFEQLGDSPSHHWPACV